MQPVPDSAFSTHGVAWLHLLHLADSALPIGSLAHSFGIETLTTEAALSEHSLEPFLAEWLAGAGLAEAVFCHHAHNVRTPSAWETLNTTVSSFKAPRETREASLRLGRRFLVLAAGLPQPSAHPSVFPPADLRADAHLAPAFGLTAAAFDLPPTLAAAAFLHQSLFGIVSASQRLLPLGQTAAMQLLWKLKPPILETARRAAHTPLDHLWNLQPMLEIASMRHPHQTVRLFIS